MAPSYATNLRIDGDRLWTSLMEMGRIGATPRGGCNRQALTDADRQGRDLFVSWCEEAGCVVSVDRIGNIFARREGRDPAALPVLVGSHLDTQPTGGRFDGVYGVLAGLEVARTLADLGQVAERPLIVACWTNEEGARFAPAMMGSGVYTGAYELDFAYRRADRDGGSVEEALRAIGYLGETPVGSPALHAAFEVHIEQGPVLERDGDIIGVVTGIQGCYWLDITLTGFPVHAGTTPMEVRRDPWRAALPIMERAYAAAAARAPEARCTFGDLQVEPGSRNTVPETLTISIDLRHPDAVVLAAMRSEIEAAVEAESRTWNIESRVEVASHTAPTAFDPGLSHLIELAAVALGYPHQRIISGAGHDSLHLAKVAPTAMIFVPCVGGLSHNEAEDARQDDLTAGANVLLHAVLAAANQI